MRGIASRGKIILCCFRVWVKYKDKNMK